VSLQSGGATEQSRLRTRRPALLVRAKVSRDLRRYFEAQDFVEVETPTRVLAPGQELHLDAIPAGEDRHLITSPEYHMKRLVAGGMESIVQFCRCFRAEEDGPFHQPEFTMIEWYRAGGTMDDLMRDCESMVEAAARAAGTWPSVAIPALRRSAFASPTLDLQSPFERVSVRELFGKHASVKLRGDESAAEMRALAHRAGCSVSADAAWDDVFYQIFLDRIEPHLGTTRPTFVFDWPQPLGALARSKPGDPMTVERFELYAGGIELANAFGELTDAVEQRRRFVEESETRRVRGKAVYAIDEKLLAALPHMPPTSGIALGFDRLLMLVLGAPEICDVLAFAYDEA
jgi:elongation factor P--(R)-beta-lysine ligase